MDQFKTQKYINIWLLTNILMIALMVIIGGITRLTESGLSMIDWNLIKGIVPPITENQWIEKFEEYKLFPEYILINYTMTLEEFKKIFFWEYLHRVWGRLIGITFLLPLIFFWYKKRLTSNMKKYFAILLLIGCFQGFMGWYMVKSGLMDKPDVSQYRLAAHLSIAFTIYVILLFFLWNNFRTINESYKIISHENLDIVNYIIPSFLVIFLTIIYGAFVAGTNAGLVYSNFPLMGETIFPPEALEITPTWRNFFENLGLIQFNHRFLGTLSLILVFLTWLKARNLSKGSYLKMSINILLFFIILQYSLGIITLKLHVPIYLGVIHQFGSLIVLTCLTVSISEIYTNKKGAIR